MAFWIAAVVAALLVAVYVARPLALSRAGSRSRAAHDEQVFRDQLAEIDKDRERGVLSDEEAEAARIEVSRRLLAAAAEREATPDHRPAPRLASYGLALAVVVGAPLGGWALYEAIGEPGLPDQPLAARDAGARVSQEIAETRLGRPAPEPGPEAEPLLEAIAEAERRLEEIGPDRETLYRLAQAHLQLGDFREAWRAYDRLIDLTGGDAPSAIWTGKAEAMILAAGGYVSPRAEAALREALTRAPKDPVARYYMATAFAQTRRPESAVETLVDLLADSPEDAPWRTAAIRQIDDITERAGLPRPAIPEPPRQTAEERRQSDRALAERLAARLEAQGGAPFEWAQLVRTWRALGEDDLAEAAAEQARAQYEGEDAGLRAFESMIAAAPPGADAPPHGADARAAVAALDARLRSEGGDAGDWLRLINSYGSLGETAAAADARARAEEALADRPDQLAALNDALEGVAPDGLRGPTQEDIEAAEELDPQDRLAMIRGMVDGLRERLYDEGGTPAEWARLVRSLGVMGDPEEVRDALDRALAAHGDDPQTAAMLQDTARAVGVAPQ